MKCKNTGGSPEQTTAQSRGPQACRGLCKELFKEQKMMVSYLSFQMTDQLRVFFVASFGQQHLRVYLRSKVWECELTKMVGADSDAAWL